MELFEFILALFVLFFALAILALFLVKSIRIYNEYERGVRFRLGRFDKVIGPGAGFTFPYIDTTVIVDTRLRTLELNGLKAITKENATVFVDVVARYSISSPELAVIRVADLQASLKAVVETVVRSIVGELTFGELIGKREFINAKLRESVSARAEQWGLKVDGIELTDITPSERTLKLIKGSVVKSRKGR